VRDGAVVIGSEGEEIHLGLCSSSAWEGLRSRRPRDHLIVGWTPQRQCLAGLRAANEYLAHDKLPSVGGKRIQCVFDPKFEDRVICRSGPIRAQGVGAAEQAWRVAAERPV